MSEIKIYLAPIQGITDYTFRNLFCKHFAGIDKVFAPFVRFQNEFEIKKSQVIDLFPKNNIPETTVPQILSNNATEILYFADYIKDLGYAELDWNLGCPFPMLTKRQLGSGILPFPERIDSILHEVYQKISIKLSIKMRLGYAQHAETFPVLEILNKYPLSEIIIHPRLGKQMYKGSVDLESFSECLKISNHKVCYNGDINGFDDYKNIKKRFNSIDTLMLGRGLISHPFLAGEIAKNKEVEIENKLERFSLFHSELFESYADILSGPGHLLAKMQQLWEYFSISFVDQHKAYKMIKKAKSIEKYHQAIYEIFNCNAFIL
jgi:tRNA-dihydrouridine synthase B